MYGINEKVYKRLIDYFKHNNNIERVILFGSRAKRIERINSDIDLCIGYLGGSKGTVVEEINDIIGCIRVILFF